MPIKPAVPQAGLASTVAPLLPLLDALYSSHAALERLAARHGRKPSAWPPGVVAQLRSRHNEIATRIERRLCSMPDGIYYPIGSGFARLGCVPCMLYAAAAHDEANA